MSSFFLFCKSYRNDVLRAKRLLESILKFNQNKVPTYLCIPLQDVALFLEHINFDKLNKENKGTFTLVTDEDVLSKNPKLLLKDFYNLKGYIQQQIIKSQIWRLVEMDNYLAIDSDSYFIKDFFLSNFLHVDETPFSLMHFNESFFKEVITKGKKDVLFNFNKDCEYLKNEFGRIGPNYDFGPAPLTWSGKVWQSLEDNLEGSSLIEAFLRMPSEIRWYGEALLKYKAISLYPITPLFHVQHYSWQTRPSQSELLKNYLGVVDQSNWNKTLDPIFLKKTPFRNFLKRLT